MKRLIIFCLFAISASLSAQGIDFVHEDLEAAMQAAKEQDKLLFVDAYTTWCGPCKRMAKNVFTQTAAGDFYNANFVNLKLDMEKGQGPSFARKFRVGAYPTLLFLDPNGDLVFQSVGAKGLDGFLEIGKTALSKYDESGKYEEAYEKGDRSYDLVFNYVKALNKAGKSSLRAANEYLRSQSDLSTENNLMFILEATTEADSRIFDYLVEYKNQIAAIAGEDLIERKVQKACLRTAKKAIEFESEDLLLEALNKANEHAAQLTESDRLNWAFDYFLVMEDGTGLLSFINRAPLTWNASTSHHFASTVLQRFETHPELMLLAERKAEDSCKSDKNSWEHQFVLAQIYLHNEKSKKARKAAKKALDLAGDNSKPVSEIERFIQSI